MELGHFYENMLKLLAPKSAPKRYAPDIEDLVGNGGAETGNG